MKRSEHLTQDLLIRSLDDELSAEEAVLVESHLSECETCQQEIEALRTLSVRLGAMVTCMCTECTEEARDLLSRELEARELGPVTPQTRGNALRRLGWGIGFAAAVALIALFVPWSNHRNSGSSTDAVVAQANGTIEVDGETFVALPYSNPDLPVSAPHIVEMQVPVASLADAGVTFEPISAEAANSDGSVLADVLVGLDGQPLGVHVLSAQ
jgi:hypothetical protein